MYEEPLLGKNSEYDDVVRAKERQLQQKAQDDHVDLGTLLARWSQLPLQLTQSSGLVHFGSCHAARHDVRRDFAAKEALVVLLMGLFTRTYMYYRDIDTSELSTAAKTEEALINALLVIVFIAFLTFGIVLLYKCNGMHIFAGYCMLYSAALLGLMGSKLVIIVLCNNLHWVIDRISLMIVMYNFAMVGVLSIFYQKGIPGTLERGYLVATSVIVAWQLAQLPEVRLYPLFHVDTLISEKGTPIPGLLFEADVGNSHIDEKTSIQQPTSVPRRRFATRDSLPEDKFIQRLLIAGQGDNVVQSCNAADASRFQQQVQAFLYDQNSQCQNLSEELARNFERNQLRLWRNLYCYYGVDYVSRQQPYPSIQVVFAESADKHLNRCSGGEDQQDKSIKLGLGDFIFYSVLVARASLHGFAVFAACFLGILVVSVSRLVVCFTATNQSGFGMYRV
ncbi:unnamed protein product [Phytophthora fragariaefolia]|uniref:Unnamed protein product n=1 Tax=Phytophthora fragariaefolia TaxID=1490495 RepID=A0A9W6XN70_9STRA|nr:unnamed protein product [Phytophthora fragariaefolia]